MAPRIGRSRSLVRRSGVDPDYLPRKQTMSFEAACHAEPAAPAMDWCPAPTPGTPHRPANAMARLTATLQLAAWSLRCLDTVSPSTSASLLLRLFLRPRRRRGRDYLSALPPGARSLAIPYRGRHLAAWTWGGQGPQVLLMHGWEDDSGSMLALVPPLLRRGFRVVALDAPGHGRSPDMDTHVVDAARAMAGCLGLVGPVHGIVAHSFGAAAASLALARLTGRVPARMALVAPMAGMAQHLDVFAGIAGLCPRRRAVLAQRVAERLACDPELASTTAALRGLETAGLVVHDHDDNLIPVDTGRDVAAAWPQARLQLTRGLGHRRILACPEVVESVVAHIAGEARR